MRKFILFLFAVFTLFSCEPEAVLKGRAAYKAYYKKFLKDPESFVVYSEKYEQDGDVAVDWELDYGAKNSFGAMTRETVKFKTVGASIYMNNHFYDLKELK